MLTSTYVYICKWVWVCELCFFFFSFSSKYLSYNLGAKLAENRFENISLFLLTGFAIGTFLHLSVFSGFASSEGAFLQRGEKVNGGSVDGLNIRSWIRAYLKKHWFAKFPSEHKPKQKLKKTNNSFLWWVTIVEYFY